MAHKEFQQKPPLIAGQQHQIPLLVNIMCNLYYIPILWCRGSYGSIYLRAISINFAAICLGFNYHGSIGPRIIYMFSVSFLRQTYCIYYTVYYVVNVIILHYTRCRVQRWTPASCSKCTRCHKIKYNFFQQQKT